VNPQKLNQILVSHALWLRSNEVLGGRAILTGANLESANLEGANLERANLENANLVWTNLRDANFQGANLQGVDFEGANLRGANLAGANLTGTDLRWANLRDANLRGANLAGANLADAILQDANSWGANLRGANLLGTNLRGASLGNADLEGAIFTENWQIVPPVGQSFGAFKKVAGGVILELLIPRSAQRTSSLIGRKCRANEALVVGVAHGNANNTRVYRSLHDWDFTYEVGKMAFEPSFDPDIRVECTAGIHFFMTKEEAIDYG